MKHCEKKFANQSESCLLFPSRKAAKRCRDYLRRYYRPNNASSPLFSDSVSAGTNVTRLVEITILSPTAKEAESMSLGAVTLFIAMFPKDAVPIAKKYWQHTGDGISSRLA